MDPVAEVCAALPPALTSMVQQVAHTVQARRLTTPADTPQHAGTSVMAGPLDVFLVVGMFARPGDQVDVVPRAWIRRPSPPPVLPAAADLLVPTEWALDIWEDYVPEDLLDRAVEECGHVRNVSMLFLHLSTYPSPDTHVGTGGPDASRSTTGAVRVIRDVRLRIGEVRSPASPENMNTPDLAARMTQDPSLVFA